MSRYVVPDNAREFSERNSARWHEGYKAGLAGQKFNTNPYTDPLNYDFCQWTYGWAFGRHTKAIKEDEDDL